MIVNDYSLTFQPSASIFDDQGRSENVLVFKFTFSIELVAISFLFPNKAF